MQLSDHFDLWEFEKSDTALKYGIDNKTSARARDRLRLLVSNVLEPARRELGVPITVSSGYRSPQLNRLVGGSPTSDHKFGRAADIRTVPRSYMIQLGIFIQTQCEFKQLIWEFGGAWIHVAYHADYNRGEVLEAFKDPDGETGYRPFSFIPLAP